MIKMIKYFYKLLDSILFNRWFLIALLAINIAGSIYGYYWYKSQLMATPARWWLFVTDSPLSTTLFAMAILLTLWGKHNTFMHLLAYVLVIKYGLWAVGLITHSWIFGGYTWWGDVMLWFSHLGMAAQGWLYWQHHRHTLGQSLAVTLWLAWGDYVDYALGFHPYLFFKNQFGFAMFLAVFLSIVLLYKTWKEAI